MSLAVPDLVELFTGRWRSRIPPPNAPPPPPADEQPYSRAVPGNRARPLPTMDQQEKQ